jgi:hypothetical protein
MYVSPRLRKRIELKLLQRSRTEGRSADRRKGHRERTYLVRKRSACVVINTRQKHHRLVKYQRACSMS